MTATLDHRGPDDRGEWWDDEAGIALGHTRLSIVDLSPSGHQPMTSASGRYVITFNGEIYNHSELRKELRDVAWRGTSDTETLLAGFDSWGVDATVRRSVGMFAFGVWDRGEHTLSLWRDRLGEKPMYYGWIGRTFVFGSELRALRCHPDFEAAIDRSALSMYLSLSYVPTPHSIYKNVHKLPPGSFLRVSKEIGKTARPVHYWDAREVAARVSISAFPGNGREAADELESLLRQAVAGQMLADVPLGAFLSGGVDSSTVVSIMQSRSMQPIRTFAVGFEDSRFDEASYARVVAKHLGTDHTELYVTPRELLAVVPRLASIYDEPFADSSQIPTVLVSQLARRHVTVSLSGDGGDELFCGYAHYLFAHGLWRNLGRIPYPLRLAFAAASRKVPVGLVTSILGPVFALPGRRVTPARLAEKLSKLETILSARDLTSFYGALGTRWQSNGVIPCPTSHNEISSLSSTQLLPKNAIEQMMAIDTVSYLPDDILCKVDRAAMSVSLETRVPLLDHRIVEFAWSLPLEYKLQNQVGKRVLRDVLYRYVPRELVERPKMGFSVPLEAWLRGPLRVWAEDLLDERRLRSDGYLDPRQIREKWRQHVAGECDWQSQLWSVLMFQAWLRGQTTRYSTS